MPTGPAHPALARDLTGVGLGLRWEFLDELLSRLDSGGAPAVPFFEVSPENYMRRGGFLPSAIDRVTEAYPVLTHGLTFAVGGLAPFDADYVRQLSRFLRRVRAPFHSDHLCFGGTEGTVLHDLLPLPHTRAAADHAAKRIREAADRIDMPFAVENITAYLDVGLPDYGEGAFLRDVIEKSESWLLLDVNNVYVNAKNARNDPMEVLEALPLDRVVQIHVAGHERSEEDDVILDTHGARADPAVLDLLTWVIARTGPLPVILERDHHVPPLDELLLELGRVRSAYEEGLAIHAGAGRP